MHTSAIVIALLLTIGSAVALAPSAWARAPKAASAAAAQGASGPASSAAPKPGPAAAGIVDINNADEATLRTLPGVDAEAARKIKAGRPWASPDDLLRKRILASTVFDKIKPRLIALRPGAAAGASP